MCFKIDNMIGCQHIPPKKKCGHRWECGCDKPFCENCIGDDDEKEDARRECENEACMSYYFWRNDNCCCESFRCGYCCPVIVCRLCNEECGIMKVEDIKNV